MSYRGRPDVDFARTMDRLESHGLLLGSKYRSPHLVDLVELLGATAVRALAADDLQRLSPRFGIPSDLSIMWDGVSM